ncbi:hypothetical protein ACJMK2_038611 [Sinanodonta woodiana]|uniref:Uncharacterized protein n=1 Tax=Sinanodonta woodiana TaxID=1069815 RepID=A0ABD3W9I6_SINWO
METPRYAFKEDFLNCSLCSKHYKNPRMLPCLHSFCESCLVDYITKGGFATDSSKSGVKGFPCPCCRKFAATPSLAKTRPTKWAEEFSENALLLDLASIYTLKSGTRKCDPCSRNNISSHVHSYCKNCRDALCESCMKTHRGMKLCQDHVVLGKSEYLANIDNLKLEEQTCSRHTNKTLEQYCNTHKKLCCPNCVAEEHRKCDDVIPVTEAAKKCRSSKEISNLRSALSKYIVHLNLVLKNRNTQKKDLEAKKTKVLSDFRTLKSQITDHLDRLEKELEGKMNQTNEKEGKRLREEIDRSQEITSAVDNCGDLLEVTDHHGSDSQLLSILDKIGVECEYYEEHIGILCSRLRNVDYSLTLDKTLEQFQTKVNTFGRLEVRSSPSGLPPSPKVVQSSSPKSKIVQPKFTLSVKEATELDEIDGRHDDPNDCWFTGAEFLPDSRILLADRTNKKLKLYSSVLQLITYLTLSSKPWDVTTLPNNEVAVSLPSEKTIQIVHVMSVSMSTSRVIATDDQCYGIHYVDGKILAVSYDGDPPHLKILSTDGEELAIIATDDDGFILFSKPIYVTATSDGSQIYVSDERLGCLVCLKNNGDHNFTYSAMDLGHAAGVTLDREGNIYVCGNTSNSVHVVSPQGDRVKVLVTDGISYPRAITFEPKEKKLLITQGDKDVVKIYSLA